MKDIRALQNIVVDKQKLADLVSENETVESLQELLGIKRSQAYNIRVGRKGPSLDGMLRLMMKYGLKPHDLAVDGGK